MDALEDSDMEMDILNSNIPHLPKNQYVRLDANVETTFWNKSLSEKLVYLFKEKYGSLILIGTYLFLVTLGSIILNWNLNWEGWMVLLLILIMMVTLVNNICQPDLIFVIITTILLLFRIIDPKQAIAGFSNEGVATVAVLFVVAKGVQSTNALDYALKHILGTPSRIVEAQLRLMVPIVALSAFLNNTPLVAMMIPVVENWSKKLKLSSSKFLIPLSYAAVLGGTCTLIGTSTNVVLVGLVQQKEPSAHFNLFELGIVGVPNAIIGVLYIAFFSKWLLPDRLSPETQYKTNPKEYTVVVSVLPNSSLVGKSINQAGLRGLSGLYLTEIQRETHVITAPASDTVLEANDVLMFAGLVNSVKELLMIEGLGEIPNQLGKISQDASNRRLFEAVVAANAKFIGKTIRQSKFRTIYDAAIIAVHRGGERIRSKIGDIVLQAGDTFLLESKPSFLTIHGEDENFALIKEVAEYNPPVRDKKKAFIALSLTLLMIGANGAGLIDLLTAAATTSFLMIGFGCLTLEQAVQSIKLNVIVAIAAAFGLGKAIENTGVAAVVASAVVSIFRPVGPLGLLFGVYFATTLLTELISNAACVILMFPIAVNFTADGLSLKSIVYVLMLAASASFSTPVGYQTNLMVSAVGGYRFTDFVKIGMPLQVICMLTSTLLCYVAFN